MCSSLGSDGLHETDNAAAEQFGEKELVNTIQRLADASADELMEEILRDATEFGGVGELVDDRTVIVLRAV